MEADRSTGQIPQFVNPSVACCQNSLVVALLASHLFRPAVLDVGPLGELLRANGPTLLVPQTTAHE